MDILIFLGFIPEMKNVKILLFKHKKPYITDIMIVINILIFLFFDYNSHMIQFSYLQTWKREFPPGLLNLQPVSAIQLFFKQNPIHPF
jgi:uncharacterized integral membrane protein